MIDVLSTRNSTLPALISEIALATSNVTVPVFGFGIRPRGPRTLPSLPTERIMSGVAMTASKSVQPPWIFSTMSSPPTMSAPASFASRCLSPCAITSTRFDLAGSVREHGGTADHLIGVLGIDSEKHRQLDRLIELGERDLLEQTERLIQLIRPLFDLLERCTVLLAVSGQFHLRSVSGGREPASYLLFAPATRAAPYSNVE